MDGKMTLGLWSPAFRAVSIAFFSLLPISLFAQVTGARLSGTITDGTGAVITRAQVTIKNTASGFRRELVTNESGYYSAPNLSPGAYTVTTFAKDFRAEIRSGITLTVGADVEVNIRLEIGSARESIEVRGEASAVETTDATLSALADGQTIRELPLNARDWTQLAALEPGVALIPTQTAPTDLLIRGNRGLGTQITVSGARPEQNNYRLDGISINDYSNAGPGSALGVDLGVDAIREFAVVTANAQADFGKTSGGVINAVTLQGTNTLHGSVYEFLRNSVLDARNFFDPASIPPFRRNQFGATLGGPVRRNHTFFFVDYEGLRQDQSATQLAVVPTQAARNGQLAAGNVTVSPLVKPYLALFPLPTSNVKGDTGTFTSIEQQVAKENFLITRMDHSFTHADQLHGTYMFDGGTLSSPDLFQTVVSGTVTRRHLATAEYTRTFNPALVNILRVGFSRIYADVMKPLSTPLSFAGDPANGFVPGSPVGSIGVTGISTYSGGSGAGGEVRYAFNSYQIYDDLFRTKGIHTFRFGGNVERLQNNELGVSMPNGQFTFTSLANFLTDQPATFTAALAGGKVAPFDFRQTIVGAYLEDDAHPASNLNVNLGLRYEMATVPTEVNGRLSTLLNIGDTAPHLGSPFFYNPTYRNFEPRIGLAWDPSHSGRTVVRSAFGVYDVLPLTYEFAIAAYSAAPFFQRGTISSGLAAGSFPATAFSLLTPNQLKYQYIDPHPKRNYVLNWNFNIQQQLESNLFATVAYVGSHGVHQPFQLQDVNIVLPVAQTPAGYIWPAPSGSGTRLNANVGQITALFWDGSSYYDALQAQVIRRMTRGLQFGAAWTWGRSMDTSSASGVGNQFLNSVQNLPWFDPRLNRAPSDFDIRHNAAINFIRQVPPPHDSGVHWFASGWEVSAVYRVSTGIPFTPVIGGDPLGLKSSNPFDFPDRISGPGCQSAINPGDPIHYIRTQCFSFPIPATRIGNAGRNILIGPGISNLDLAIFKNNYISRISERFNVQFRAEFFNVLNNVNFSPPLANNTLFGANGAPVSTAGLIATTSTSSRQIQMALKIGW